MEPTESFSWMKAASFAIFMPMVVNLIVLATYLIRST
jgi:hypothetical protein